ncbi:MAG: hypothetical protein HC800_05715 [Phormidesmis sp. RL_2_1]|nr:hypothetical protein [Phormidesmis sp. RL_2_1]
MDVFACSFCQHLFTANLQAQSVQLADSLQPMAWYWNGISWRTAHHRDTSAALIWLFASTLTVIPVVIIALANYIFPPLESYGSSSAASVQDNLNFPVIWTGLTLISHGAMSLWLLAEYHRWPWYIASGIRLQRMGARWFGREPVGGN